MVATRGPDGSVATEVLLLLRPNADPDLDRTATVAAALGAPAAATLRRVVAVRDDEIPAGPTGKVRKFALRERQLSQAATAGAA